MRIGRFRSRTVLARGRPAGAHVAASHLLRLGRGAALVVTGYPSVCDRLCLAFTAYVGVAHRVLATRVAVR